MAEQASERPDSHSGVTRRAVVAGLAASGALASFPAIGGAASAADAGLPTRSTLDLAGTWEFGTDGDNFPYEVAVPNFLVPVEWWLYDPDVFPEEVERVASYGYDPATVTEGWYRRTVDVPASFAGRRIELQFDGIAMYSEITVNGALVEASWGMWRSHRLDVTEHVQAGAPNTIAVYVKMDTQADRYSHGEFSDLGRSVVSRALGIWESTRLVATDPVFVEDVFFKPRADGADIEITIVNDTSTDASVRVREQATSGGHELFDRTGSPVTIKAGQAITTTISVRDLRPVLWSPDNPSLYLLTTSLERDGGPIDAVTNRVGFRTFEVVGNRFHLNGQPYWLRGAGQLPTMMVGRDKIPQMRQWLSLLHSENVRVARMHMGPAPSPWFDLADELGMGLDVEGIRQWAFGGGTTPDPAYTQAWRAEMVDVVRRLRNHPSILFWTTGNEMGESSLATWTVLSDLNKAIRAADSTRPINADSAYVRDPPTYEASLKPAGIDDGDVDDAHIYPGWYQPSAFVMDVERANGRWLPNEDRPFISSELGTGYPDFRTGQPWPYYLNGLKTPQAWVGAHAADEDPAIFLATHALLTKELAEMLRRTRDHYRGTAGFLLFSTACWYKDFYSSPSIEAFPVGPAVAIAYQPVLVSLDDFARHFYAGERFRTRVAVVNDDMAHGDYRFVQVRCEVLDEHGRRLAPPTTIPVEQLPYDAVARADLEIKMPQTLAAARVPATLNLEVTYRGATNSRNHYDIVLARYDYISAGAAEGVYTIWLYDPHGSTRRSVDTVGLSYTVVDSLADLHARRPDLLVVGKDAVDDLVVSAGLFEYAAAGGRVVILEGGARIGELFPDDVASIKAYDGEVVTPVDDGALVFTEMEPMDMRWWRHDDGSKPYTTHLVPQLGWQATNIAKLGIYTAPSWPGYTPSFDDRSGHSLFLKKPAADSAGYILVSQMATSTAAPVDPLAGKLLANLFTDLSATPVDPGPPSWAGFTEDFENGLDQWQVDKGDPTISSAKAHTGEHSLGQSTGSAVIYRRGQDTAALVTLWFYDDAASRTGFMTRVDDGYETGHWRGLGVNFRYSTRTYMMRIDGAFQDTKVPRQTGWHEFSWDYTSGQGATMAIDGQQVASVPGLDRFNTIALGDWWAGNPTVGTEFIDDLTVTTA